MEIEKLLAGILKPIDKFLNNITMYRLVLYGLILLSTVPFVLSVLGLLPYTLIELGLSMVIVSAVCFAVNEVVARVLKAQTNIESVSITSLILFLVIQPVVSEQSAYLLAAGCAVAMLSKFVLAFKKRHIFNPAAVGIFFISLFSGAAIWWVSSIAMLPFLVIIGFLVLRKLKRFEVAAIFVLASFVPIIINSAVSGFTIREIIAVLIQLLTSWPTIFFASIMLTEPFTIPGTSKLRVAYAAITGLLFNAVFVIGPIESSPQLALLLGNLFTWATGLKKRIVLTLEEKTELAPETYQFKFTAPEAVKFIPGQYLELTLPHKNSDDRGNRRYFTIASSPNEKTLNLGIKFITPPSSYKQNLKELAPGKELVVGQIAGDFSLPKELDHDLVFMAGGIGITPFRSILQYMIETNDKRKVTLFYGCNKMNDIPYKDFLDAAEKKLNLKVVYVVADKESVPADWSGETGFVTAEILKKYVHNFITPIFYISGPGVMVDIFKKMLFGFNVSSKQLRTDYFPGFA